MTTTAPSTTADRSAHRSRSVSVDPVRRVLAVDAGFCLLAGTALLASAVPIAEHAELAAPTVVRAIGAFLLLLGVDLALFARAPRRWADLGAAVTAVGDVAWAAGSVVLAATAGLPAWATAIVLGQAAVTLAIGAAKRFGLRAAAR